MNRLDGSPVNSLIQLNNDAPLGIFDSGLGGLTVVRAVQQALPFEDIIYLGDTARVPYGTRSPETVVKYARSCSRVLVERGVKMVVIACNTVSAVALDALEQELSVPVLGVIGPGAKAAIQGWEQLQSSELLKKGGELSTGAPLPIHLGIVGTASTIASGAYPRAVAALKAELQVFQQPAPLFVPLVEEGWLEGPVPELAAERYLKPLVEQGARVFVLGCTHYPLLKPIVEKVLREKLLKEDSFFVVVDSAEAASVELLQCLSDKRLLAEKRKSKLELLVTDAPRSFEESASRFLGRAVGDVQLIDLVPFA